MSVKHLQRYTTGLFFFILMNPRHRILIGVYRFWQWMDNTLTDLSSSVYIKIHFAGDPLFLSHEILNN